MAGRDPGLPQPLASQVMRPQRTQLWESELALSPTLHQNVDELTQFSKLLFGPL